MEDPTVILTASDIVEKANNIINKINHAMLVCNLKDHNRYKHLYQRILLLTLIASDSERYAQEDVRVQMNRLLCKYDKIFTRLLKDKPSEDEYIKTALGGMSGSFDELKSMLEEHHETTT